MKLSSRVVRSALAGSLLAAPLVIMPNASATPQDDAGEHKVTICHVTNSATNPYVIITVDVAAFDGEDNNDHTQHLSHDGRTDFIAVDGQCVEDPHPDPTPDPEPTPDPGPMP